MTALLQTDPAHDFFRALAFWDAKRPITKKLLQRIDLLAIMTALEASRIAASAQDFLAQLGVAPAGDQVPGTITRLRAEWSQGGTTPLAHRP